MDQQLTYEQINQLSRELKSGNKLAAVKLYKEWTGCTLMDAKDYVEAMEAGKPQQSQPMTSGLDQRVVDQILEAIQQQNKLEAVKLYKVESGKSLMESKLFIEKLMKEIGIEEEPRRGCAGLLLVLIVIMVSTLILR